MYRHTGTHRHTDTDTYTHRVTDTYTQTHRNTHTLTVPERSTVARDTQGKSVDTEPACALELDGMQ